MLRAGDSVDFKLWQNCVPLRYNFYHGTCQMKLLDSRQFSQARDIRIFEINDIQVHL